MKEIKILNEVFNMETTVVLCKTDKEFDSWIEKNNKADLKIDASSITHTALYYNLEGKSIILLSTNDISIICHEVTHLVFDLCNTRGIPINIHNDEIVAYNIGFYMKKIIDGLL